jgi:hypothetical protein
MFRTVWFALICLSSLGVLFALKASVGSRSTPEATTFEVELPSKPDAASLKPDQQASADLDDTEPKLITGTVEILPIQPDPVVGPKASDVIASPPDTNEITSWHWHEGSKVIKRTTAAGQRKFKHAQARATGVPEVARQPSSINSQANLLRAGAARDRQAQPRD